MEKTVITLGNRSIPLTIRWHGRARRISLKLSPARDGILLILPKKTALASGLRFFHRKQDWVLANVAEDVRVALDDGTVIPVMGEDYVIRHQAGRGVGRLEKEPEPILLVHGDPSFTPRRVRDFLTAHLEEECTRLAHGMATLLDRKVKGVRVRRMHSRWGSASHDHRLSFSWWLVFAPRMVVEYLVAHEVAHLAEMNHSPKFWKVVELLYPDYKAARDWLKHHGHGLYRYG